MKRRGRRRALPKPPRRWAARAASERKNPVVEAERRVVVLRWFALAAFALIVARLGWLQLGQREHWQREAELTRTRQVALSAERGRILDRAGRVIADNRRAWDLELDLSRMLERGRCAPLALTLLLRHFDDRAGRARTALAAVLAEPAPAVDRFLELRPEELASITAAVARVELQEWGRGLLIASGATTRSVAEQRSALAGEGARPLGEELEADRARLLEHLQRWSERLRVLERCAGAEDGALAEFLEKSLAQCEEQVEARIASALGTSAPVDPAAVETLELKPRLEWWRRARQRARTWLRDLEYDPAIFFLAQHADELPGFAPQLRLRREYASEAALAIVGTVAAPTDEEREEWNERRGRLQELRRLLQRSDEEQAELLALQEELGVELLSPHEIRGQFGLELVFEERLRGKRGTRIAEWDVSLDRPRSDESVVEVPPAAGEDLQLTLDLELQEQAEELLSRAGKFSKKRHDLEPSFEAHPRGALVVVDARTGAVIVAASHPHTTRDELRTSYGALAEDQQRPLFPRAFQPWAVPQPGSVFKTFVALRVLDQLQATPEERLPCGGSYKQRRCRNHSDAESDLWLALEKSCNCYFYRRAEQLGAASLTALARDFGFGERTGIELPQELPGKLGQAEAPPEKASGPALLLFAIGQVVPHTTPLQIARAYAAVARGALPELHFVASVAGRSIERSSPRAIDASPRALAIVRQALARTVDHGTANDLAGLPWTVAGKTGTAERYEVAEDHSWVAGWLPREDPRWVFVVFCERANNHGSDLAAPLMRKFLESEAWAEFAAREAER
jgi:cell division protein FtsI/penicillin-binding protein 2